MQSPTPLSDEQRKSILRAVRQRLLAKLPGKRSQQQREDLEGPVVLSVMRRLTSFEPARSCLETFVNRCVDTALIDCWRQRTARCRDVRRTSSLDSPHSKDPIINLHGERGKTTFQQADLVHDTRTMLAQLPAKDRHLCELMLHHSVDEVAQRLGVHRSTVYRRLERLRRQFERSQMDKYLS